jgi:hypothetical protein
LLSGADILRAQLIEKFDAVGISVFKEPWQQRAIVVDLANGICLPTNLPTGHALPDI